MKQRRWFRLGIGLVLAGALALGATGAGAAFAPFQAAVPLDIDSNTHLDANNIDTFVMNQGGFAHDRETGNSGLVYPKGTTKTAIFAAGLWLGAKINGAVRVTVAEYSWDYAPGPIVNGQPVDYTDPRYRVYKIDTESNAQNNPDYAEWPDEDGAPVDSLGNPLLLGDQTLWAVYNDMDRDLRTNNASSVEPLGVEVQQTSFAFDRQGSLGDVAFFVFKIINKGQNTLEDMYVGIWSDPDLGGASDDLVGSDTTLSLGYTYNATNSDNLYGSAPPAVGFDFFQGPIVPSPGDTAHVSGRPVPDYRNLPMTSFNKYINGTDPESAVDSYNYMQGLNADGTEVVNPVTGETTTYVMSGDPVSVTGWLDSNPADRRMMLSSGPFTMAPGDTQEVVTAVVVGQGQDRLTSITALKFNDLFAQAAFDANFDLPSPPPTPVVRVAELDEKLILYWGERSELEYAEEGYAFEGYNVYMGASVAGPWQRIATFDENNNIGIIFDDQFDLTTGVVVNKPVQFGADTGVQHRLVIETDFVRGGPLANGRPYFLAVTSYAFNPDAAAGLKTLENSITPIRAVPQMPLAGTEFPTGTAGDTLAVERVSGNGDGIIVPIVVDPTQLTGDTYEIQYGTDEEGGYWTLRTTDGRVVFEKERNLSGDESYLVTEGIYWKVVGALPGFRRNVNGNPVMDEIVNAEGADVPPDGKGGPGNDVFHSLNSLGTYYMSAGGGDGGAPRFLRNEQNVGASDIVMRWDDADDNWGWWAFNNSEAGQLPFGLYLKDPVTGEETRLLPLLYSGTDDPGSTPGVYDFPDPENILDAYFGFPATDWVYAYEIGEGHTYEEFVEDAQDGVFDDDITGNELFARLIVGGYAYDPDAGTPPQFPGEGTVIFFATNKPTTENDVFRVSTAAARLPEQEVKNDLDQIRVVPNPYYAHSAYELNQFERVVKFTRLPRECTIRIFNIAGDLVRTLEKEASSSSFMEWNLLTGDQLPVASGVYIYHVEAREGSRVIGSTVGRMAIFVEKERLNTF